jgi:hypothetical protein
MPCEVSGGDRMGLAKSRSSVTRALSVANAAWITDWSVDPDNFSAATVSTSWPAPRELINPAMAQVLVELQSHITSMKRPLVTRAP